MSRCPYMSPEEQARELGRAWETLPDPRPLLTVEVAAGNAGRSAISLLGPHAPELQAADIELLHSLWREFTERYGFGPEFHQRNVIRIALRRLEKELHSRRADEVVEDIRREVSQDFPRPVA